MAINKNHEVEELEGTRCAIVERNVSPARTQFLKELLELNGYKVIVAKTPPPKVAAAPPASPAAASAEAGTAAPAPPPPPAPETYTVGVTNITFNSTNAIMGRLLKAKDGHVVTLAYWHQKEAISHDAVPYFGR